MARPAFVSYARADASDATDVEVRLRQLGFEPWADRALRGGQLWWDEILDQIRRSDAFVAIISAASLDSQACARERSYAEALLKPVVPVLVERIHVPLPADVAARQVVDFRPGSSDAAFALASALIGLPDDAPLPDPLPPEPEMPLSYLSRLVEQAEAPGDMPRSRQHEMLNDLEPGLRATDPEERLGAWHVLAVLEVRPDLFADAARRIERLRADYSDQEPEIPELAVHADRRRSGVGGEMPDVRDVGSGPSSGSHRVPGGALTGGDGVRGRWSSIWWVGLIVAAVLLLVMVIAQVSRSDGWETEMRAWLAEGAPISEDEWLLDCDLVAQAAIDADLPLAEYLLDYGYDTFLGIEEADVSMLEAMRSEFAIPDSVTDGEIAQVAAEEVDDFCGF
jgi:hypothetical protein